ncbi:MAG: winged helix-turn-helix domain-containing protein [Phycisphaerales bacterium]
MNFNETQFRIYNILKKPQRPMKTSDIAKLMNCTPQNIWRNLTVMMEGGAVERYNGRYYKLKGK